MIHMEDAYGCGCNWCDAARWGSNGCALQLVGGKPRRVPAKQPHDIRLEPLPPPPAPKPSVEDEVSVKDFVASLEAARIAEREKKAQQRAESAEWQAAQLAKQLKAKERQEARRAALPAAQRLKELERIALHEEKLAAKKARERLMAEADAKRKARAALREPKKEPATRRARGSGLSLYRAPITEPASYKIFPAARTVGALAIETANAVDAEVRKRLAQLV